MKVDETWPDCWSVSRQRKTAINYICMESCQDKGKQVPFQQCVSQETILYIQRHFTEIVNLCLTEWGRKHTTKQMTDLPAFSAGTVNRTSPALWGGRWDGIGAPHLPARHSSPPGHPAWSSPYWCTPGSALACSPPETIQRERRGWVWGVWVSEV